MFYQGNHLPHWHPPGHPLMITSRLAGSLPKHVLEQWHIDYELTRILPNTPTAVTAVTALEAARRYFLKLEAGLEETIDNGPTWLRSEAVQAIIIKALLFSQAQGHFRVLAVCVMSNHLHTVLVLAQKPERPFRDTWTHVKHYTATRANQLLGRKGEFWETECFDHVIRDSDIGLGRAIHYVAQNPVKAGLCQNWRDWAGTWLAPAWAAAMETA